MENNFKLIVDGDLEIIADKIDWVTWNGTGLDQAHDSINIGRSLILDFKPMSMDMLLAIKEMNYDGLSKLKIKSAYKHLTEPTVEIIENTKKYIKFVTENHTYELYIKANEPWLKSRSPFSLG